MKTFENNRIEFKEILNEDFEKEVVAFLNYSDGGIIYVGVDKNGKAIGIKDIDSIELKIKDRIKNNISPSTLGLFDIMVEKVNNKNVIKILISSGPEKPYYLRKKGMTSEGSYLRVGSAKEPMTSKMIQQFHE